MEFVRGPLNKKKKGQIQAMILYGVAITVMAIVILIGYRLLSDVNDNFQDNDLMPVQAKESIDGFTSRYSTIFDAVLVSFVVLLALVVIISGFLIDTHPIFYAISFPAFLAVILVNAILSNVVDDVGRSAPLIDLYAQFGMMQFIAAHWLVVVVVTGFVSFITLYMKRVGA